MTEVTYFVALPFIAADDGVAPGEAVECFNPTAVGWRALRRFRANRETSAPSLSAALAIPLLVISATRR
jgi:hypothetical protein